MESKLLNLMLYRQTLLQKHLWNKLKELEMQMELQKSFLSELKEASGYLSTGFSTSELRNFPVVDELEVPKNVLDGLPTLENGVLEITEKGQEVDLFAGRHPLECQE